MTSQNDSQYNLFNELLQQVSSPVPRDEEEYIEEEPDIFDDPDDEEDMQIQFEPPKSTPPNKGSTVSNSPSSSQQSQPRSRDSQNSITKSKQSTDDIESTLENVFGNFLNVLKDGKTTIFSVLKQATSSLNEKQQQIDQLQSKIELLTQEKEEIQKSASKEVEEKEETIRQLTSEFQEIKEQHETMEIEHSKIIQAKQQEMEAFAKEYSLIKKELEVNRVKSAELSNLYSTKSNEMDVLNSTISLLTAEVEELKTKLQNATTELEQTRELAAQAQHAPSSPSHTQQQPHVPMINIVPPNDNDDPMNVVAQPMAIPSPASPADKLAQYGEVQILRARLEKAKEEITNLRRELLSGRKSDLELKKEFEKEVEKYKTQLMFKDQEIRALQEEYSNALKAPFRVQNNDNADEDNHMDNNQQQPSTPPNGFQMALDSLDTGIKKRKGGSRSPSASPSKSPRTTPPSSQSPSKRRVLHMALDKPQTITAGPGMKITIEPVLH